MSHDAKIQMKQNTCSKLWWNLTEELFMSHQIENEAHYQTCIKVKFATETHFLVLFIFQIRVWSSKTLISKTFHHSCTANYTYRIAANLIPHEDKLIIHLHVGKKKDPNKSNFSIIYHSQTWIQEVQADCTIDVTKYWFDVYKRISQPLLNNATSDLLLIYS